jgi:glycosyltransferase involved in cell wall biosynthesis
MTLFGVPAARLFRTPRLLSSQRAYRGLARGWSRRLLRFTDRLVDGIVVNCKAIQRHLIEDEGVPAGRIHLCYNGIDTALFHPIAAERPLALAHASVVIGVVCALRPEKDLGTLLEAFAQVRKPGVRLAIVGAGPERPRLVERARQLRIASDCHFEPATPAVADWLRAIDIFVLPSVSEALSNSLMEAMACGCCAVASRVGGNPELVAEGQTGMLFAPRNASELASKLRMLIEDESLRKQLAEAGARFLRENFSLAKAARRMAEIYREI